MTLFLNNEDVKNVLTMDMTIKALEESYELMIRGKAVCRPRIDLQIATSEPLRTYRWGTMEGGSAEGYFAIRMKSDVLYEDRYWGTTTLEKYCVEPGKFCGIVFLFRVNDGEPLAIMNDGVLQHMRVGADSALGVKYMAKEDAKIIGMFGSGGMARTHIEAIRLVRQINKIKVFSPTKRKREAYATEMEQKYNIEAVPVESPEEVYKNVDILCGCTDASEPVILGKLIEKGVHITSIGGRPDKDAFKKIDRFLRLGNATLPVGYATDVLDEFLTYVTPIMEGRIKREHQYAKGTVHEVAKKKVIYLKDVLAGRRGRNSSGEITYSERGNLQGAQFYAIAGKIYEMAKKQGLGREIPTEWFLQDIRD